MDGNLSFKQAGPHAWHTRWAHAWHTAQEPGPPCAQETRDLSSVQIYVFVVHWAEVK